MWHHDVRNCMILVIPVANKCHIYNVAHSSSDQRLQAYKIDLEALICNLLQNLI